MNRTRSPAHCYKSFIALPIVVAEKALWRSLAWSAIVHLLWGGGRGGWGYGFLFIEARTMESTYSCLKKYCWSKYAAIHNFEWNKETTWGLSLKFLLTEVLGYVALIQALNALLARRKNVIPLGYIPTLHHLLLAVGSAIMFLGCLQTTVVEFERSSWLWGGPKQSIDWVLCSPVGTRVVGAVFFWSYVYYLSEFYELLDTFILILKKRPLTFLHVFHHATVIIMCYLWLQFVQSLEIITLLTNTIVHVIMYSYYFLCSINHPPPWKKLVTNLQKVQFLFSFVASVATLWLHFKGRRDGGGWSSVTKKRVLDSTTNLKHLMDLHKNGLPVTPKQTNAYWSFLQSVQYSPAYTGKTSLQHLLVLMQKLLILDRRIRSLQLYSRNVQVVHVSLLQYLPHN